MPIPLRKKIAQMLIMGFSGAVLDENSPVIQWLRADGLGGVLLFDIDLAVGRAPKNLINMAQIQQLTQQLKEVAAHTNPENSPLLVAIDYEGGAVDRLSSIEGCRKTLSPCEQARLSDADLLHEAGQMAMTLNALGFNLNFAPVVDLSLNEQDGIIGRLGRSFSSQPDEVIRAARQFVKAFNQQGIVCSYKHFPGHGSALGDTHHHRVDVTETYIPQELEPYRVLAQEPALAAMIMTAHVVNRHLDASGTPATLSFPMLTQLLRHEIGFEGVIVSDDLQMQAISQHYALEDALRLTLNAGADMLILGNQLGYVTATEVIDRIEKLVDSGLVPQSRIEDAYRRILQLKGQLPCDV